MAPIKRTRQTAEDEDDEEHGEIVSVREARSSLLQGAARKKARVSIEEPKRPAERTSRLETTAPPSDSEDDDPDGPASPPQTQYEIMRDAGFSHLRDTDWDDQQATQKLARRTTQLGNNAVAEGGIIESITCFNFMCHERLHVELGPLINFVVGENGSGKSAVLTALTLCLGGKASDTNRGGSLKSFVKEGQEHGNLVVKIKNAGSDAYQPDIYGDSIIVERHFSKTGSSGFKIKSATGRTISTKKHEVDEISEWYALQINNPLTVLSQDNARQFLNSATPAQKYKYFVSGVQLEQLDNDYKLSQDTLDKTLLLRDDLNGTVAYAKKEMEEAKRLADTATKNENLRAKARHYRNQIVWAQVVEEERALEARDADLVTRDQHITEAEEECDKMTKALIDVEEKLARVTAAREAIEQERDAFNERTTAAEAAYQAAKKDLTDLHREERDAFGRLKTVKADIEDCEQKIVEEERRLDESSGPGRAEKDAELTRARARDEELTAEKTQLEEQTRALKDRLAEADGAWRTSQQSKDRKRKDIVEAEAQLRDLEKRSGSAYDGFDRDITGLVKAIAGDTGFEHQPIGPMGAHIKLLKPVWSGILEKTLGDGLNAFVVRSKRDQTRLSALIRRTGIKRAPPIYIAYGGRIDTRDHEPDAEFDTILRVLEFTDDLIRSQLVINNQIEKIILVEDRGEANRIMVDNGPPRNVAACLCFHDGQTKRGQGLRITSRSGPGSAPIDVRGQRPRMQTDSASQVALQKEHLRQLGLELRDIMSQERLAQQAVQGRKAELETHLKAIKSLENESRRIGADIQQISTELDAFEGVDDRLVNLRNQLEVKRGEESQLGAQYGNMRLAKHALGQKSEEAKSRLDAERAEESDYLARMKKASDKVQSHESIRRITVAKKNDAFEKLDMEKNERQRAEEKRDRQAAEVARFVTEATAIVPDRVFIPDGETHASVEKKFEKIREQLQQREKRLGATDQQIFERSLEAKKRHDDVVKQVQDLDDTIKSLKRAIGHRLHLWRQFQRQISARVRIQFNYLLSERGFRGKIDLDHRSRKVNIQIEPDETRKSSSGRNTKTLSGGEKSFSSICMLLSVWEAIGSPIRCLDEFDVFMDNVNRAISTNMLVDVARRSVSRQYILITPNAIEGRAKLDKDVRIIRLTDPRQRTLV